MQSLRLAVPVFSDWDSFAILRHELDHVAAAFPVRMAVSAVDDGSTILPESSLLDMDSLQHIESLETVYIRANVGHQQAIAVGLCISVEDEDFDAFPVMDADGEDPPHAIVRMLHPAGDGDYCIVARRGKRSENLTFRLSYLLYKILFRLLTGRQIDFGNFCLLSRNYARRLVSISPLWSNLPAAVLCSRLPIQVGLRRSIPKVCTQVEDEPDFARCSRAQRNLGLRRDHLRTISVPHTCPALIQSFSNRLCIGPATPFSSLRHAWVGDDGVTRYLHDPLQAFTFTLSFILSLLNNRMQRLVVPHVEYKSYVDYRQTLLTPLEHAIR